MEPDHSPDNPFADFDGYEVPRYTQVPDQLFDEHLPFLGHAELKVLLFIIRRTFGWGKDADAISLSQLERGTGLSRRAVREAVKSLEDKRLIVTDRYETPRGDAGVNVYRLNIKKSAAGYCAEVPEGGKNLPGGRGESTLGWGTYSPTVGEQVPHPILPSTRSETPLETLRQETLLQQTSLSQADPEKLSVLFFRALGYTRIPRKKRERATQIISQLLQEGFSPHEVAAAIELAAARNARDAGILPYVIGEAVVRMTTTAGQPQTAPDTPDKPPEDEYEEILTQLRTLPVEQQRQLREAALRRLGNRATNEAVIQGVMIGLFRQKLADPGKEQAGK